LHKVPLCLALSMLALPAVAEERMQIAIPGPFELAFEQTTGTGGIREWIFPDETLENWTRMITYQRFANLPDVELLPFMNLMTGRLGEICPGASGQIASMGEQNGYEVSVFFTECPDSPAAPGNPEITLYKLMRGMDALHILQFAWRYKPHRDEVQVAIQWSTPQMLCDPQKPDSPCQD